MIEISKYGIHLVPLDENRLEAVREWRNSASVSKMMEYRDLITAEQQKTWFNTINWRKNLYWVIEVNNEPAGLSHLKKIDWHNQTAESGIFIGNPSFRGTPFPVFAVLTVMEFAFELLSLKKLKAKIFNGNEVALAFNKKLGYEMVQTDKHSEFNYYTVTNARFRQIFDELNLITSMFIEKDSWCKTTNNFYREKLSQKGFSRMRLILD